jgi:long-chain-acyl-CoA dehydrogenase
MAASNRARPVLDHDHEAVRASFRTFIDRRVAPRWAEFESAQRVPREVWLEAGRMGFLATETPSEYGGADNSDFRFNAVIGEEINARNMRGFGLSVHSDIVLPYLLRLGTPEQKARWLPGMVTGEIIAAIAMTEPGAGSDLSRLSTTAQREGAGDDAVYVVRGQKTFITNGQNADIVITAVRTGEHPYHGISLLVIERDTPGFTRGRPLSKLGIHANDTSELFFDEARVPARNLLGEEGKGFVYLVQNLPRERLALAIGAVASAEHVLDLTTTHVKNRKAFRGTLADLQNTQFVLAQLTAEARALRVYIDDCLLRHTTDELDATEAAMAKLLCTELQVKVADACLQLHGGMGFMEETEVARVWRDSRAQTIYGGSSEVMRHIIAKEVLK